MRVNCPFCGPRELGEFAFQGDATPTRPAAGAADEAEAFYAYVYERDNPAGQFTENWYHAYGCRAWLRVTRNTVTHEVTAVEPAAGVGARTVGA